MRRSRTTVTHYNRAAIISRIPELACHVSNPDAKWTRWPKDVTCGNCQKIIARLQNDRQRR